MSGQSLISSDAYKCWLHVIHIKSWCHYKELYGCNVWTLRYALTHTVHYMTRRWYVIASPDTYTYESNPSLFHLFLLYPSSSSPPSPFLPSPFPSPSTPVLHAVFEEPEDPSTRSFFSEIIASISDVKFSHGGRYILSRDYLTVKVGGFIPNTRHVFDCST